MSNAPKTMTGYQVVLAVTLGPPAVLLRAFVITRLWEWFVMPFGIMGIGIAHAFGLLLLLGIIRPRKVEKPDGDPLVMGVPKVLTDSIGLSVMALILGRAVAGMMP